MNKYINSNKGSISLFMFVAILFIAGALMLMYATGNNKSESIEKQINVIGKIYESPNQETSVIYNEVNTEREPTEVSWLSNIEFKALKKAGLGVENKQAGEDTIKGYITEDTAMGKLKAALPVGFYYVGGKITTGLVISDEGNDAGQGIGITTKPGTLYDYDTNLLGNQFVWVPSVNYVKGGFYVGRFITGQRVISVLSEDQTSYNMQTKLVVSKKGTPVTSLSDTTGILDTDKIAIRDSNGNIQKDNSNNDKVSVTIGILSNLSGAESELAGYTAFTSLYTVSGDQHVVLNNMSYIYGSLRTYLTVNNY